MKLSGLYGKKIADTKDKKRGVILAVSCVKNTIEGYICFDEQEKEFFASAKNSHTFGDLVSFESLGKENENSFRLRLGLPVYTKQGKFLGRLSDCVILGGKLTYALCGSKKIPFENLIIGDAIIVDDGKENSELYAKNMFINAVCNQN